eukprot:SAG22_NODE_2120_length_2981_cov_1.324080_5_plen_92_part_00
MRSQFSSVLYIFLILSSEQIGAKIGGQTAYFSVFSVLLYGKCALDTPWGAHRQLAGIFLMLIDPKIKFWVHTARVHTAVTVTWSIYAGVHS